MKKIFIAMMAMAAFAACATEDTLVAPKGEAITFGNAFIDNATKAIDGTYTNIAGDANELKAFNVYGTVKNTESVVANIFNGLEVEKQNGAWVYDEAYTQYWVANNTYNFAAVVNGTVAQGVDGMPVAIAYDATQATDGTQDDLLYAEVLGVNYANNVQPVKFTFNHLLSKMKVTVKNQMQNGNGNSYKVTGVKVLDATKTATYDVVNKAWGAYDDVHNVHNVTFGDIVSVGANSVEDAKKLEMGDTGESNYERLFIPQTDAALKISIDVEYYVQNKVANADGTHTDVLNNSYNKVLDATHTFVAGRAYNFVITLGNPGEPITFAVEDITDWVEEDVIVGVKVVDETNIEIYSEEGLRWFADQVNSGADTFAGKTVKLTNNITLTNLWTPIGVERVAKSFQGTFDGQNYTISNLKVNSTDEAGFFGYNWKGNIKNVKFDNANIVGAHYAGVVVGWADGAQNGGENTRWSVENCHVTNSTVTVAAVNNDLGDKAGAIVGYAYAIDVLGCSVATTTIKAYRDLGGIVGILNTKNLHTALVDNCVVGNGVTLIVDNSVNYNNYTAQSQYNVNHYAGRVGGTKATVGSGNSGEAIIIF